MRVVAGRRSARPGRMRADPKQEPPGTAEDDDTTTIT